MIGGRWLGGLLLVGCGSTSVVVGGAEPAPPDAARTESVTPSSEAGADAAAPTPARGSSFTRFFPGGEQGVGPRLQWDGEGGLYVSARAVPSWPSGSASPDAGPEPRDVVARLAPDGGLTWTSRPPIAGLVLAERLGRDRLLLAGAWAVSEPLGVVAATGERGERVWSGALGATVWPTARFANGHLLVNVSGAGDLAGVRVENEILELDDEGRIGRRLALPFLGGVLQAMAAQPDGGWVLVGGTACSPNCDDRRWPTAAAVGVDLPNRFVLGAGPDWRARWSLHLSSDALVREMVSDSDGAVILAGEFGLNKADMELGGLSATTTKGESTAFVAKISSAGQPLWLRTFRSGGMSVRALAVDEDRALAVGGSFSGQLDLGGRLLVSRGGVDGFVLFLGKDGALSGALAIGDDASQSVTGLTLTRDAVAIAGTYALGRWSTEVDVGTGWTRFPGKAGESAHFVTRIVR